MTPWPRSAVLSRSRDSHRRRRAVHRLRTAGGTPTILDPHAHGPASRQRRADAGTWGGNIELALPGEGPFKPPTRIFSRCTIWGCTGRDPPLNVAGGGVGLTYPWPGAGCPQDGRRDGCSACAITRFRKQDPRGNAGGCFSWFSRCRSRPGQVPGPHLLLSAVVFNLVVLAGRIFLFTCRFWRCMWPSDSTRRAGSTSPPVLVHGALFLSVFAGVLPAPLRNYYVGGDLDPGRQFGRATLTWGPIPGAGGLASVEGLSNNIEEQKEGSTPWLRGWRASTEAFGSIQLIDHRRCHPARFWLEAKNCSGRFIILPGGERLGCSRGQWLPLASCPGHVAHFSPGSRDCPSG